MSILPPFKKLSIVVIAAALSACNTEALNDLAENNTASTETKGTTETVETSTNSVEETSIVEETTTIEETSTIEETTTTEEPDPGEETTTEETPPEEVEVVNNPPVISGTPLTSVVENSAYSFVPTASDQDGDELSFFVTNLPNWASFDLSTGELSGTPTAGSYNDITITVSDGQFLVPLTAFDINVTANNQDTTAPRISNVQVRTNSSTSVTISWNTDELANSELDFGSNSSYGNSQSDSALSSSHSYTLTGLTEGSTYHYQLSVADSSGNATSSADATFTMSSASQSSWVPPIGIPTPEFGIDESHMMYEGAQYDFGNGLVSYPDAGNGPYTHYVDNQNSNATDSNNPYGTPSKPRLTIPKNLSAGSVVEVHNGPYNNTESVHGGTYLPILDASGTAHKPIFIRGANANTKFEIGDLNGNNEILVRDASYLIIENAFINGPAIKIYQPTDHLAIRHSEITGENTTGVHLWTYKLDYTEGELKQDIVIYNNEIHDNGPYPATAETGDFGVMIDNASRNIWVIDNNMYNNGDDSVQIIDRYWVHSIRGNVADGVFIGRNIMHHDGENAIDAKGSKNVIISQNEIYGYTTLYSSSAGEAIRINDEGEQDNIWVIYNHIYDSQDGIDPVNAIFKPYVIGNLIHDVDVAINRDATVVTNNTIYNCSLGVDRRRPPHYELSNNIIANCDNPYNFCSSCGTDVMYSNIIYNNGTSGSTSRCVDCLYEDPLLGDPSSEGDFLGAGSSAVDAGGAISDAYDIFFDTYGIDIRKDIDGNLRPAGSGWDIGAHEVN